MKKGLSYLCVLSVLIYILSHPYEITYYASVSLKLCATAVVPSLFMFIVLSKFLTHLIKNKCCSGKKNGVISRLFGLPTSLLPICLCGLFCGAPSGAVGIGEIYSSGLCTKDEAERALILSNNCSAAFIMSIAASSVSSTSGAIIILVSNIFTSTLVYLLLFKKNDSNTSTIMKTDFKENNFALVATDSITSAVNTIVNLCGYVVFFYCLSAVIAERLWNAVILLTHNHNAAMFIKSAVSSFFEMTTGVLTAASLSGNIRIMMISGAVAFCGLSVIFQVMSVAGKYKLSCTRFFYSKLICAFVSPLITLILLFIIPKEVSVMNTYSLKTTGGFTSSDLIVLAFVTCVFFIGAFLLSYLDKKHKN